MTDPPWTQRFGDYRRVVALLGQTTYLAKRRKLSALEQAGLVQRFELALDLAWKTLRDFLADAATPVAVPVPIEVLRAAFHAGLIEDGDGWIAALRTRNTALHTASAGDREERVAAIRTRYEPLLRILIDRLTTELAPATTDIEELPA